MMKQEQMTVVRHKPIAKNIYELTLSGHLVEEMNAPGQFVHVKVTSQADPLLRRPLSLCRIDQDARECTLIYRKEGIGTTLLSEKRPGETIDVLGPLGNGFPLDAVEKGQRALFVGGGIGVPPLYELAKQLVKKELSSQACSAFKRKRSSFMNGSLQSSGKRISPLSMALTERKDLSPMSSMSGRFRLTSCTHAGRNRC